MTRSGSLIVVFWIFVSLVSAQEVNWADRLIGVSTAFDFKKVPGQYMPDQALGPPSMSLGTGASGSAWAPGGEGKNPSDFIEVGWSDPVAVNQIIIHENYNPGAISRIILKGPQGQEAVIFEQNSFEPGPVKGVLFHHNFPKTSFKIQSARIELKPDAIPGFNQIDAVGLRTSTDSFRIEIDLASTAEDEVISENLGKQINSETDELLPVISPDGKTLFFTRQNHPMNYAPKGNQCIWYAEITEDGSFSEAQNIGRPLNNRSNNSVNSITPDGQTMLLLNVYKPNGYTEKGISFTTRNDSGWNYPEKVRIRNYYNESPFGEYFLAVDGKTLIMTVQREESIGSKDIFVSFLEPDGTWTKPLHTGPVINTVQSEIGPFLAADGKTLYYATSGFPGFGKADMYVTKRLDDTWQNWSKPKNLGPNLNSKGFDAYYTIPASGDYAYYVSHRNSIGKGDIFRVNLPESVRPEPVAYIRGRVINGKTNEPIGGKVIYEDLKDGKEMGIAHSNVSTGEFSIVLPTGRSYGFLADAKGFIPVSENIDLTDLEAYEELEFDLVLIPLEEGEIVRLNNVFFDTGKHSLRPEAKPELRRVVKMLNDHPQMKIKIAGHTDNVGNPVYNQTLSENRAREVYEFIVESGIGKERLEWEGFGLNRPISHVQDAEGRQKNRRVEFEILKVE